MHADAPNKRFYEQRALEMPPPESLPSRGEWIYPVTMSLRKRIKLPPNPWFLEDFRQRHPEIPPVEPVHVDSNALSWAFFKARAGLD